MNWCISRCIGSSCHGSDRRRERLEGKRGRRRGGSRWGEREREAGREARERRWRRWGGSQDEALEAPGLAGLLCAELSPRLSGRRAAWDRFPVTVEGQPGVGLGVEVGAAVARVYR